jgi:hypothetical protein
MKKVSLFLSVILFMTIELKSQIIIVENENFETYLSTWTVQPTYA